VTEPRKREPSSSGIEFLGGDLVWRMTVRLALVLVSEVARPSSFRMVSMSLTSSIWGMFWRITGWSVRQAAAIRGMASFLLP
jgi:hypothetical protein